MHSNLVIVRAGDNSLHPGWLGGARDWDIIVNYFGDNPDAYRQDGVRRIDSKGPKWPALHDFVASYWDEIAAYDYVWFPDDDLACDTATINRLFETCREYKLDLAQPALTYDSHIGVGITLANRSFRIRFTNFVEIMAPCFSRDFLKRCAPSFNTSLSGWGLDLVWPTWTDPLKSAIIDTVQVRHTRPHGGPNYNALKERGVDPEQEFADLLKRENLEKVHIIRAGFTNDGKFLSLANGDQRELVHKIMLGYLPEYANHSESLFEILQPILQSLGKSAS